MPTPTKGPRLGAGPTHERMILSNMSQQLFEHKRITTTVTKAKRLRPVAERLITFAKRGDLASRRRVMRQLTDKSVVHELFTSIAPAMGGRDGGYTRITKIGNRNSMKYHVPGSRWYSGTTAEIWFDSPANAEAAGFQPAGGAAAQKISE